MAHSVREHGAPHDLDELVIVVKIRDEGVVRNKSVYLAIGVTIDGTREVLGIWIEQTEGAKFWLKEQAVM